MPVHVHFIDLRFISCITVLLHIYISEIIKQRIIPAISRDYKHFKSLLYRLYHMIISILNHLHIDYIT